MRHGTVRHTDNGERQAGWNKKWFAHSRCAAIPDILIGDIMHVMRGIRRALLSLRERGAVELISAARLLFRLADGEGTLTYLHLPMLHRL